MTKWVAVALTEEDARKLYDHTGTMPHEPDTWTGRVRRELASVLEPQVQQDEQPTPA